MGDTDFREGEDDREKTPVVVEGKGTVALEDREDGRS
jgi:hypothetical protein